MRFHKFDNKELLLSTVTKATNELLKKHGIKADGITDDRAAIQAYYDGPTSLDLAKESIRRKEETRMERAKNE